MNVREFVSLGYDTIYRVVDANGFMVSPIILTEADKNVVRREYGDKTVIGFEIATKKILTIYIK